jgi:hypothetical protein
LGSHCAWTQTNSANNAKDFMMQSDEMKIKACIYTHAPPYPKSVPLTRLFKNNNMISIINPLYLLLSRLKIIS